MDRPRHSEFTNDRREESSAWSDDALLAMVRAADEVDELDASAARPMPMLRLAGTEARRPSKSAPAFSWSWRWVAAAAALVAIGFIIFSPRVPSAPSRVATETAKPSPSPTRLAESVPPRVLIKGSDDRMPEREVPVKVALAGEAAVILTISQDADGRCRCVTSVTHQLAAGQSVGDLATTELLGVGLQRLCETAPERVLVLGMSGPRELLPQNKAEAERFASCLDHGPGHCDADATCFASSALACVSPAVNIVAETVAMRK